MRIRTLATAAPAAVLLAAALGAPGATAAPAGPAHPGQPGAACTRWQVETTPVVPGAGTPGGVGGAVVGGAALSSVSALSPSDAWFAGYAQEQVSVNTPASPGAPSQTWVLRWTGSGLTQPAQPTLIPFANHMDVWPFPMVPGSFDSDTDGWQVFSDDGGSFIPSFDPETTLAEHWHDGRWTMTPMAISPDPAAKGIRIQAVAAVSPHNAWAVGTFYAIGPGNLFGLGPVGTLIEHWDGTAWSIVPNPAGNRDGVALNGLAVVSPSDIWAVGVQDFLDGQTWRPLTEHWDGTAWTVVPAPAGQGPSQLLAISADGPGDAWAVGTQGETPAGAEFGSPMVEHWDGHAWAAVSLPAAVSSAYNPSSADLDAVYAAAPSDVWAGVSTSIDPAAQAGTPAGSGDLLHWDGRSWTLVSTGPQEFGLVYSVSSLSGTGAGNVWAAGQIAGADYNAPLAARLSCGSSDRHA